MYFWCSLADLSYCYYFSSDKIPKGTYTESSYVKQQWNIYSILQLSVKFFGLLCLYFCSAWKDAVTLCITILYYISIYYFLNVSDTLIGFSEICRQNSYDNCYLITNIYIQLWNSMLSLFPMHIINDGKILY